MPTALNKKEVCEVMGWTDNYAGHYKSFRAEMEEHCIQNDINGVQAVGKNRWNTFMDHASTSNYFIMKGQYRKGDKLVRRKLDLLLQDVCKQWCAKLNRNKRRATLVDDDSDNNNAAAPPPAKRTRTREWTRAVKIYIVDPPVDPTGAAVPVAGAVAPPGHPKNAAGKYVWMGDPFIGMLEEPTMAEVWKLVSKCCPAGRHARQIWGSMDDLRADGQGFNFPGEAQFLADSNQVEAFFLMTKADPICLLAVLSTVEIGRPNLAIGTTRHPLLDPNDFAPPEYYNEPDDDEEAVVSKQLENITKQLPRKDTGFEERIRHCRIKERKWQEAKRVLKRKHKVAHAAAIHSDDEGEYYHMYYPAAGGGVPADIDAFVGRRAQAVIDAAATNAAAAAAGNVATFRPAAGTLPNPRVDGPNFEWPHLE